MLCRCSASTMRLPTTEVDDFVGRVRRFLKLGRRRAESRSPPSPRSTACPARCATRKARWSSPRRAATARSARTSRPTSAPSPTSRSGCPAARPTCSRFAARSICRRPISPRSTRRAGGRRRQDLRQSAQRRRRLAAPEGSGDHRGPAAALLRPWLGRGLGAAGGHPVRGDARDRRLGRAGQQDSGALHRSSPRCSPTIARSRRSAPTCRSTSTASSTRSTGSTGSDGSARWRGRRAGRWPINSPPNGRKRCWRRSTSRSAAPAN